MKFPSKFKFIDETANLSIDHDKATLRIGDYEFMSQVKHLFIKKPSQIDDAIKTLTDIKAYLLSIGYWK